MSLEVICEWGAPRDIRQALEQVLATKEVGATHAKWQLIASERLASKHARRYWDAELGGDESQLRTFRRRKSLSVTEWEQLFRHCGQYGVTSMVTPFWVWGVEILQAAGVESYKLASGDITFRELFYEVKKTGKPAVMSTGAANRSEIERAYQWLGGKENGAVTVMGCDLMYPCSLGDSTVKDQITELSGISTRVGFSDHTTSVATGAVAVSLGATCLEKHVTLEPGGDSPDDNMALSVDQMKQYCTFAQEAAELLGTENRSLEGIERLELSRVEARRSAYARKDIPAGEKVTSDSVDWLRPCRRDSIPADVCKAVYGKMATERIQAGEVITWDYLEAAPF